MPYSVPYDLPDIRRVVTGNNDSAQGIVTHNETVPGEPMGLVEGARGTTLWVTTDGIPTNDNNSTEDGARRPLSTEQNLGLAPPDGTSLRSTDLAPGAVTPMHRTATVDYNILVSGEAILVMDDGSEVHLRNPGDVAIQRGAMHAWRNPSPDRWARWISVLMGASPACVNGRTLPTEAYGYEVYEARKMAGDDVVKANEIKEGAKREEVKA